MQNSKLADLIADVTNAKHYLEDAYELRSEGPEQRELLIEAGERLENVVESITAELGWSPRS